MSQSAENDAFTTDLIEWAVQCLTRDGDTYTGKGHISRKEAQASGERLERINGAQWWLVSRRRVVTVETSPWSCVLPPAKPNEVSGDA